MAIRLRRHLGRVESLEPGQYTLRTASGQPAICCPGCGGVSDLPTTHAIGAGGVVVPIWSCPTITCPLMEFLELESVAEEVAT